MAKILSWRKYPLVFNLPLQTNINTPTNYPALSVKFNIQQKL